MDVLRCLAANAGEVVTREELFSIVWEGTIVSDDVLTRSISELRKVFGDDPRRSEVIETIPKTGYRLIAPVVPDYRGDSVPPHVPALELVSTETQKTVAAAPAPARRAPVVLWSLVVVAIIIAGAVVFAQRNDTPKQAVYQPIPLTSFPGSEGGLTFSPNGRQIAFTWGGTENDNQDIYVKLVGSETPLRLTDNPAHDHNPAWSPDGSQIAYMQSDTDGCSIYIVSALGGPSQKIASCGSNIYGDLAWSPDGAWLAFNDKESPGDAYGLYLLSPTTLEKRKLTAPRSDFWGDHDPAFSPDGGQLSFTRSVSEGMQDIYLISVDGNNEQRLTSDSRNILGHTWKPDGEHLVFSSNRTGRAGLWELDISGGEPRWLGLVDGQALFPDISRQGNRLGYVNHSSETNIWRMRVDQPDSAAPVIASTKWDLHPAFSPDASKIAFTSNRSGSFEIWTSDSDGGEAMRLTSFGGPFTSTPRWSPDGTRLVFTSRPGGQADLYIIEAEGTMPRRLTSDPSDEMAASLSRDGKSIYFSSNRSGSWEVWKMPSEGGDATMVMTGGGFGPKESPDKKWIYHTRHNETGLWRTPATGGSATRIIDDFDPRDWGSWEVSGEGVFYVSRGNPTVLAFYDLATSRTDTLFTPAKHVPGMDPSFTVSTDGKWLLFGQMESRNSDLMLVGDFE